MNNDRKSPVSDTVSFIRHPIFNEKRQLWGYQVVCIDRCGDASHRLPVEGDVSALIASSSYMGLEKLLSGGKRLMVAFNQKSILDAVPYALPAASAAVKIDEKELADYSLLPALEKLKTDNYRLAIGRFSGDSRLSTLYQLADIFCLETAGKNKLELNEVIAAAKPFEAMIMGEQVMDAAHFERCSELGFSLFQGSFFKTPEKISVRKISSNEAARFQLIKIIEENDPDFDKLAKTIQTDVSISLRLLTYLNSAAFGFRRKISSIQQAITMLGWENMKRWLRVVILSDVSQHKYAQDLVLLSSQRGKFLEAVIRDHDFWGFSPDSLFLLGIFSLLDTLLGMPMDKVVEYLPLDDKLKAALCRDPNSEYYPLLKLAEHLEDAEWETADRMIQQLSMNNATVKIAFHAAVDWANEMATIQT
jgi:c-di-GMP phosphodiesterase